MILMLVFLSQSHQTGEVVEHLNIHTKNENIYNYVKLTNINKGHQPKTFLFSTKTFLHNERNPKNHNVKVMTPVPWVCFVCCLLLHMFSISENEKFSKNRKTKTFSQPAHTPRRCCYGKANPATCQL